MKLIGLLFTVFILSLRVYGEGTFSIVSVSPLSHSLTALPSTEITIQFNGRIDLLSFNDTTFMVWGRWSGVHYGNIELSTDSTSLTFTSAENFFWGEMVTVSLSKGIKDVDNVHLGFGYSWNFWIKVQEGTLDLTRTGTVNVRQQGEGHIQTYGTYAGDLDGDGWSDFIVPNENTADVRVFMNDQQGGYDNFTIFTINDGARPSTNEGFDFNLDGLMDFAVGNSTSDQVTVFLGDGTGGFSDIQNYTAGNGIRGLVVLDANGDGFGDIVTANRTASNVSILLNNGNGTFAASTNFDAGGNGETACANADVNNDGIMDLFVGAYNSDKIILLLGDGNGGFNFHSETAVGANPWMVVTADFNGDDIPDVANANAGTGTLSIVFCDSSGNLQTAVHYPVGNFPISVEAGDVDGDGDIDVATSNFGTANFTLYENNGKGVFINPKNLASNSAGSCAVFHDRDNDGDMDMTGIDELEDLLILFENQASTDVEEEVAVPNEFYLSQNYPNPFNPNTNFKFRISDLPAGRQGFGFVSLKVYDILGNEVATLINEEKPAGEYEIEFNGEGLSSGMYFYTLKAGNPSTSSGQVFSETKKMILLK